jgi:hypothetical protein
MRANDTELAPHSMSATPAAIEANRFCESTGTHCIVSFLFNSRSSELATNLQRSIV